MGAQVINDSDFKPGKIYKDILTGIVFGVIYEHEVLHSETGFVYCFLSREDCLELTNQPYGFNPSGLISGEAEQLKNHAGFDKFTFFKSTCFASDYSINLENRLRKDFIQPPYFKLVGRKSVRVTKNITIHKR